MADVKVPYLEDKVDIVENSDDVGGSKDEEKKCVKIELAKNIAAYLKKVELLRDTNSVSCNSSLVEKVTLNYIIAKQILSTLSWQEKLVCKHVCTTWHSAIQTLKKEQLYPEDFVFDYKVSSKSKAKFKKSGIFANEPLAVLAFANIAGVNVTCRCKYISPNTCSQPCGKDHCLLDLMRHQVCLPKECMLLAKTNYHTYLPLPQSVTYKHNIIYHNFKQHNTILGGVYIPKIPNVEFNVINIKAQQFTQIQKMFYDEVNKIAQNRLFKGILIYVTENFLLETVEDIVFLNYFREIQPNLPFAFGGCLVEDTLNNEDDVDIIMKSINDNKMDVVTENLISIGVFSVPKNIDGTDPGEKYNFDMFSFVMESTEWTQVEVQKAINDFSKSVPHFEHSLALKLSCVGRDRRHDMEQNCFRAAFPHTRIIGCYGNGEIGINHPERVKPETIGSTSAKRSKGHSGPEFKFMHSYSTIFVYIGWGKIISQPQN